MGSAAFESGMVFRDGAGPARSKPTRSRTVNASVGVRGKAVGQALSFPVAYEELTDAEVMLRAGAGDDAAFDFLVAKFTRPMMHFLYRFCGNRAVAEELAQEVFLRVYRSRERYSVDAKFTTWLYRIATNLAMNHARDTRQEKMQSGASLDEPDPSTGERIDPADESLTVEQDMVRRERMAAIRNHVMDLPERQRAAVLMHKYQEMDYREIGKALKLSESATKSLLFRAYETLRDKLKDFV